MKILAPSEPVFYWEVGELIHSDRFQKIQAVKLGMGEGGVVGKCWGWIVNKVTGELSLIW